MRQAVPGIWQSFPFHKIRFPHCEEGTVPRSLTSHLVHSMKIKKRVETVTSDNILVSCFTVRTRHSPLHTGQSAGQRRVWGGSHALAHFLACSGHTTDWSISGQNRCCAGFTLLGTGAAAFLKTSKSISLTDDMSNIGRKATLSTWSISWMMKHSSCKELACF